MDSVQRYCKKNGCHHPLLVQYRFPAVFKKSLLLNRPKNMWRYRELLPVFDWKNIITLGEGMSPLLRSGELARRIGLSSLFVKDESSNPTGSFKARGLSVAISKAMELGIGKFAIPTAGNAGSALAAYCAKAGLKAHIFMPKDTPEVFKMDCRVMGAEVNIVDGTIQDCGSEMAFNNSDNSWFDVSTLKEPYRLEGKKTMGFEIAEQLDWKLPDVILYPTGGGTGLIGIWKAFKELKRLGWIDQIKTRMVAVQVNGCAPVVKAFQNGLSYADPILNPLRTIANGLRVPNPFGHRLIMHTLYQSKGIAVEVDEDEIMKSIEEMAEYQGLFMSPEGAATWAALKKLKDINWIKSTDKVVILNTGSVYKYIENLVGYRKKLTQLLKG
jgi:threonine synthase